MKIEIGRRRSTQWIVMFAMLLLVAAVTMAQAPTTKTTQLNGTVVEVDGNTLVVKMADGSVQTFTPPPDRKFKIDGKDLTVSQLQPGTTLNATVTETSTPGTQKTVETLAGTVRYAAGPTVVLKLDNGEVKQYFIDKDHPAKFSDSSGKEITVFDLKKGMNVKATKITESPTVELAQNVAVTGSAPKTAVAQTAPPAAQSKPAAAPAAKPAAPAAQPAAEHAEHGEKPKKLPHTGSDLPMIALLGLLSMAAGLAVRAYRVS